MVSVGARELGLFIENDGALYRQQGLPIIKNLVAKKAKGEYDREKAVKLYMHLAEAGAKKYAKQNGDGESSWSKLFPKADREQAAREMVKEFESEFALGNYDEHIPKKYQAKAPTGRRR